MQSFLLVAAILCATMWLCQGVQSDCSEEAVNEMFMQCDADKWIEQKINRAPNPNDKDIVCRAQAFVLHCHERAFAACPDSPTVKFVQGWMPSMEDMWSDLRSKCPGIQ